jgi:hypothetical protein
VQPIPSNATKIHSDDLIHDLWLSIIL